MRIGWDSERLTRQRAIRCEIDTSISLFLSHRDHVSAHVLAWAGVETLRGIANSRNIVTFHEILEDKIKPDRLREWRDALRKNYNFAKHADRDPELEIEDFRPESTSYTLFGACHDYHLIFAKKTWPMIIFQSWFQCRNPKLVLEPMRSILPQMAELMESPADSDFLVSTQVAVDLMQDIILNPERYRPSLPKNWADTIEW